MRDNIVALIVEAARELGDQDEIELPVELTADTRLFGEDGILDSMALVSLIVAVEQMIEEQLGFAVSLADDKALSQKSSPYQTIGTLADYAAAQQGASH
ncbi:MAG: acyl carrier protein [Gammaproteobacteria bacterium]|nr:acyl carrier protein [Gammaproteobacteria bacterium]